MRYSLDRTGVKMAITNPNHNVDVEQLGYYHTKDKTERTTEITNAVSAEATLRTNADNALQGSIDTINGKIPSEASSSNKLADKQYVTDAISVSEATFRGNFATKSALDAYTGQKDKNDTAIVEADETKSGQCSMYQYDGSAWVYKYKVRDVAFTAAQMNAINSGVTSAKVADYDTHIASKNNPHEVKPNQVFSDYSAHGGEYVKVKPDGTGFEYGSPAGAVYTAGTGISISAGNVISAKQATNADIDEIFA